MARKKKKKKFQMPSLFDGLREETVHGIWAVLFFVLAVFFGLSAFSWAGVVGNWVYESFYGLFGIGYYLIPILFLMLAITYTGSLREHIGGLRAFGATLFFVSSLALIDLVFEKGGGFVGAKMSAPLEALFDKATLVILPALVLISIFILFDLPFSFSPLKKLGGLFKRKKKEKEVYEDEDLYDDYEDAEDEIEEEYEDEELDEEYEEEPEEEEEEPKEKKLGINLFGKKKGADAEGDPGFRVLPTGSKYAPPPLNLLEKDKGKPNVGDIKANANLIKRTFSNFGIEVEMDEVSIGPTVTRYALKPAEGVRLQRILGLQNNIELALAAHPVRIEAPIPGRALVGIEVPNTAIATIGMAGIIGNKKFKNAEKPLTVGLGKDIEGEVHYANLAKMPHCLIAGTTGSGKSVMIHSLINSLLYKNGPQQLKFIMIDPKRVELTAYRGIPHLITPVITQGKQAILALKWASKEMERRYEVLEAESVRDVESYHANILAPALESIDEDIDEEERANLPESMPYIVIVIDELADIMSEYPKELEASIVRLAAKSRAVGIHLVLSTQRPSVNVVTGLIKANIPTRMALQVPSLIDSRTIIDGPGAEKLLGKGDMLYLASDSPKPIRVQSPFISEAEVKKVVKYLKKKHVDDLPEMIDFSGEGVENGAGEVFASIDLSEEETDPLYEQARLEVIQAGKASTSYLQRKLRIGYSRAARLMDLLEERGVIGPADGSKPRTILDDGSETIEEKMHEEASEVVLNPLSQDENGEEYEEDEEVLEEDSEEEGEESEEEYEENGEEEYEEESEDEESEEEDDKDLYSKR